MIAVGLYVEDSPNRKPPLCITIVLLVCGPKKKTRIVISNLPVDPRKNWEGTVGGSTLRSEDIDRQAILGLTSEEIEKKRKRVESRVDDE